MIKKTLINNKWVVSGFKDNTQDKNIIKTGFQNKIFKVFDSEIKATEYINNIEVL